MRTVPAAITAARQSNASRLCKIWRIERTDDVVLRFTEHDRDLEVGAQTYYSTASFDPSSIKASGDLSVDDLDVVGAFDNDRITAADLLAGRYYRASFVVAEVLWDDTDAGEDILRWGWLGTIKESGGKFTAELLGPTAILQQPIGKLYSASCRAVLGDAMCGVGMTARMVIGTVVEASSRRVFTTDSVSAPENDPSYFTHGIVTFTTGENAGIAMEVFSLAGGTVTLLLSLPFDIAEGDEFTISAGCDHSRETCIGRFSNILNFQGEPDVPVSDDIIKGPVRGVDQGEADQGEATTPPDGVPPATGDAAYLAGAKDTSTATGPASSPLPEDLVEVLIADMSGSRDGESWIQHEGPVAALNRPVAVLTQLVGVDGAVSKERPNDVGPWPSYAYASCWFHMFEDADPPWVYAYEVPGPYTGNQATNARVNAKDLQLWYLDNDYVWRLLRYSARPNGQMFGMDMIDYEYINVKWNKTWRQESKGSSVADIGRGDNGNSAWHAWLKPALIPINYRGLAGCFFARRVLDDPNGIDDRASCRVLAAYAGDYLKNEYIQPVGSDRTLYSHRLGGSRFKYVTNDWRMFGFFTTGALTDANIRANPPPFINT